MKKIYLLLITVVACTLCACNAESKNGSEIATQKTTKSATTLLSPADFQAKMEALDDEFLIDLRTHGELHQIGPIARSRNIDFNAGRFEQLVPRLPKDKPIMLYCASGGRSAKATQMLKDAGISEVYDLDGGIKAWQAQGLPIQAHHHHH